MFSLFWNTIYHINYDILVIAGRKTFFIIEFLKQEFFDFVIFDWVDVAPQVELVLFPILELH